MKNLREVAMPASSGILGALFVSVGLGISVDAAAQPVWHNLEPGEHAVGFRLVQARDDTRVVPGLTDPARPIHIYMWYPATASPGKAPMRFGRYPVAAEDDVWPAEIVGPLRERLSFSQYALARSLGPDGFEALGEQPVRAFDNAEPLPGPFPLIVIGMGLYYESPVAFAALGEYLAGRGFVVATCPLAGTHSPIAKLDLEDLETQVRDMEAVVARARSFAHVIPDKLGVMGFDVGGMAGVILAMRNAGVDAFASVSSGILFPHPSGLPASAPDYAPRKLRVPWMHAGAPRNPPPGVETASLFETAVHSDRYRLQLVGLEHVDPTSYALVEGRAAMPGIWSAWSAAGMERHKTLSRYVSEFFKAFLADDADSLAFLERSTQKATAETGLTMEHRSATPRTLTYAEFVDAVLTGDAASAIDEVRDLRVSDPEHMLLSDFYLYRLGYSLLYSWGLQDESMQLAKLNVELNPSSTLATQILSMNHVARGDYDAAIGVYRALLESNPDDENIQRTIEWLQGQMELWKNRN